MLTANVVGKGGLVSNDQYLKPLPLRITDLPLAASPPQRGAVLSPLFII
jgi:hypothetical protein